MKILLLLSWQCKGKKGSENSYFGRKKKKEKEKLKEIVKMKQREWENNIVLIRVI